MTDKRLQRLSEVAYARQMDLAVILENVHDPHNIGAVLRTCDSVGVPDVYVLYTDPNLDEERLALGKNASSGARRWLNIYYYTDIEACFAAVRKKYERILSTHLDKDAQSIYQVDFTKSMALLLGNEHSGVSEQAQKHCDGNLVIPQVGMVRSLNISVACAVTLYEVYRQRTLAGKYSSDQPLAANEDLLSQYKRIQEDKIKFQSVEKSE